MPKQTKYVKAPGGRQVSTSIGCSKCKVGNRGNGKPVAQQKTATLQEWLTKGDLKKHHHTIRVELRRRGELV